MNTIGNPTSKKSFDWSFFFQWMLATTLGWVLGASFLDGLATGAVVGALQWLVLRSLVHQAGWWFSLSTIGWAMGQLAATAGLPAGSGALAGIMVGGMLGFAQWLVLRRWFHQDGWWVLASMIGWTLGLVGMLGYLFVGTVAGALTGVVMELQLRRPRQHPTASPPDSPGR